MLLAIFSVRYILGAFYMLMKYRAKVQKKIEQKFNFSRLFLFKFYI